MFTCSRFNAGLILLEYIKGFKH